MNFVNFNERKAGNMKCSWADSGEIGIRIYYIFLDNQFNYRLPKKILCILMTLIPWLFTRKGGVVGLMRETSRGDKYNATSCFSRGAFSRIPQFLARIIRQGWVFPSAHIFPG